MNKLQFKKLTAKNFLCFGPSGIEINFENYGNIVLIRGINKDILSSSLEDKIASNGTGKSSVPEILVYGLFGKTIKDKLKQTNVINNVFNKKLEVTVEWDNYKVVRRRKPDSLELFEGNENISSPSMVVTQEKIINILGLNYDTFVNIVVFTDNNFTSFLDSDAAEKRKIIDNLLNLDRYRELSNKSKDMRKICSNNIKLFQQESTSALKEKLKTESRIKDLYLQQDNWKNSKLLQIQSIQKELDIKSNLLNSTKSTVNDSIQKLQDEINLNNDKKEKYLTLKNKICENLNLLDNKIVEINEKLQKLQYAKISLEHDLDITNKNINHFNNHVNTFKTGEKCPTCLGEFDEKNYKHILDDINVKINNLNDTKQKLINKINIYKNNINKCNEVKKQILNKIDEFKKNKIEIVNFLVELDIKNKNLDNLINSNNCNEIKLLEEKIVEYKTKLNVCNEELNNNPYVSLFNEANIELNDRINYCEKHDKYLDEERNKLPYLDFFVNSFSDDGIRKFIIRKILNSLNSQMVYWLEKLIDGKIKVSFNENFEEIIENNPTNGDPFVYAALSGGEKRRVNLAISQAFARIKILNTGCLPSLIFLDEVTTNVDPVGVSAVFKMIQEISKTRQVFVTTHDHDLIKFLSNYDSINLEKKNGITHIVK